MWIFYATYFIFEKICHITFLFAFWYDMLYHYSSTSSHFSSDIYVVPSRSMYLPSWQEPLPYCSLSLPYVPPCLALLHLERLWTSLCISGASLYRCLTSWPSLVRFEIFRDRYLLEKNGNWIQKRKMIGLREYYRKEHQCF